MYGMMEDRKVANDLDYEFPERAEECAKQFCMKQFVIM